MGGLPGAFMTKTVGALKGAKKWISMGLALLLVGYIVYYIFQNREDFLILKSIRLLDIGLLFMVVFFSTLVSAVRLLVVMKRFGLRGMNFPGWFRIFVLARFFNRLVPQGGNLYRALKLKKENGFSLKNYTLSFLSYTWVELVVAFVLISGVIGLFQPRLKIGAFPALPFSILSVVVLIVVPLIYHRVVKRVPGGGGFFSTSLKDIGAMVEKTLDTRLLLKSVFLCVLTFVLALLWFYLGFRSIGVEVGIGALSVFTVIMRMGLIASLTPGNIGVLEIAYGVLASSFGFDFSMGLIVAAVTRTVSFLAVFLLGVLFGGIPLVKSIKKERKRESDECVD